MNELSFNDLKLSKEIQKALMEMGYEVPTPIQQQAIPFIMDGHDLMGQAQTGTGKTAAFGIPILESIQTGDRKVQVLVLCPTRELAIQVTGEIMKMGQFINGLQVVPVYGGQSITQQLKALKRGAHVIVGTPGRTIDHLKRGSLHLDNLRMVVLDEADEMLNMGFREDIETILSFTGGPIQTVMFSATVSKQIREIMKRYMNQPETVTIDREVITATGIDQYVTEVRDSIRTEAICRFMDMNNYRLGLVFCNTKRQTEILSRDLQARGYAAEVINGDLRQSQRDKVMNRFRNGDIDLLVATDVAARGIDVDDIDVVFNYDIPQDPEYYVHRIGRTGRAGRKGTSITFASGRKLRQLRFIQKQNKIKLKPLAMPSDHDVRTSRMEGYMSDIVEVLEKGGLRPYIEQIETLPLDRFTHVEIAAALLKKQVEANKSLVVTDDKAPKKHHKTGTMTKLQFNVGKKNKIHPGDLVGAIANETGIPGDAIGHIEIHPKHTFVDIPGSMAGKVIKIMNTRQVKGKKVKVSSVD